MPATLSAEFTAETYFRIHATACMSQVRSERVEREALRIIAAHPHFRGLASAVEVECRDGRLVLTGRVPTFFYKQLLQEALRTLDGVHTINNQVMVESTNC
ncbi:BON domain protein [Planctomycetes bacterium CA13]|uniref:BON domain protein n=1 Tax=Novipirellula herctigrandis TaxID=2527986 RepID=A0A5C5YX35_9BACT|nr:BON domain protein [Planctomycetes bacterium CA13]